MDSSLNEAAEERALGKREMDSSNVISDRRAATTIGVLFIIGTVAGVLSIAVTNPILGAQDYLTQVAARQSQMVAGALLVLTMGFALAMVPAVFYPVGKRYNEVLAMGYVIFRGALEAVIYIVAGLGWLMLVALSSDSARAAGPIAGFLKTAEGVIWDEVIALPFVIGALMFYYVLYQSRLVPRWLSMWGLVGAVLYIGAPLTHMLGLSFGFLMAPLAVQEMVMAVWLIARGFSPQETRATPAVHARTLVAE